MSRDHPASDFERAPRHPVAIVGAGPGDPALLTLRARTLIDDADIVVHDRLVSTQILDSIPKGIRRVDVGKARGKARTRQEEIHRILILHAAYGLKVVRLKGGDPFVYGRGSEEREALEEEGFDVEIVPGLSSALTAPLAAGIPVTERGYARAFAVLTVETKDGPDFEQLRRLAHVDTLVLLMGAARLPEICFELMRLGRSPHLPAAVIERATQPGQRVLGSTLRGLAGEVSIHGLSAPMTIVIGEVARHARSSDVADTEMAGLPTSELLPVPEGIHAPGL